MGMYAEAAVCEIRAPVSVALAELMLVVLAAFTVEASLGFGATLVTVALGSLIYPIDTLLPAFVPLNLVLSGYIASRYRRDIDVSALGRRIAPAMLAGMPVGILAFRALPEGLLKRALAAFVLVLAAIEIWRLARETREAARPLPRAAALGLLALGGVVHGAFGTGGPLAVYVAGRDLGDDKARFRSTLSTLWLVLNSVLLVTYAAMGRVDGASARMTLALAPPLALGLALGEALHARVPMKTFKVLVFTLLAVAGVVLLVRG